MERINGMYCLFSYSTFSVLITKKENTRMEKNRIIGISDIETEFNCKQETRHIRSVSKFRKFQVRDEKETRSLI